jgi:hypothetical protein
MYIQFYEYEITFVSHVEVPSIVFVSLYCHVAGETGGFANSYPS